MLQYDLERSGSGGGRERLGYASAQLYDYAFNYIEPLLEGIPGVASAAPYGGQMRQINVVVDLMKAQARGLTANDVATAVSQSNALLPSGELLAKKFDANVYTNAIPTDAGKTIGDGDGQGRRRQAPSSFATWRAWTTAAHPRPSPWRSTERMQSISPSFGSRAATPSRSSTP